MKHDKKTTTKPLRYRMFQWLPQSTASFLPLLLSTFCRSALFLHIVVVTPYIWNRLGFLAEATTIANGNCNVTIRSSSTSQKNGTFSSPNYPNFYAANLRCLYYFIALPHERVSISFSDFSVKGTPPGCSNDYVDVYTQAYDPYQDLLDVPLHGRFCGNEVALLPRLFISMHHVFVIGFYTDRHKEERGFNATYTFFDGSIYNAGIPAAGAPSVCGQTVFGDRRPIGEILSPTYPGAYPDNLFCFYRLQGVPGQRIRLTFIDVDLYSGGDHCPFDYVRVYDGPSNSSEPIGTYCGQCQNASIFSSGETMYIEFVTKSGRVEPTRRPADSQSPSGGGGAGRGWPPAVADVASGCLSAGSRPGKPAYGCGHSNGGSGGRGGGSGGCGRLDAVGSPTADGQRSGFRAQFEITGHFVALECDQIVLSRGESTGIVTSPNYPNNYPLNVTCHYYVDGLVDKQNLEKTKLEFAAFDVPTIRDGCSNGYLSAYLHGQDITTAPFDHQFCGHNLPPPLVTSHPRLLLVFNTTGARYAGRGFKARYQFVTDYAIPGTPATTGVCQAYYRSGPGSVHGTFNSPRHPSSYPDNMTCIYEFFGGPNDQVRITFENFKIDNSRSGQLKNCTTDYVDVYSLTTQLTASDAVDNERISGSVIGSSLIGRYCGEVLPGPQISEEHANAIRVVFVSNHEGINTGFRAKYEFIERKAAAKRCFKNVTTGTSNHIDSPNYPHKYLINSTCEWLITTRQRNARILLTFEIFTMEGNAEKTGCGNAVLKIFTDPTSTMPSHELCGPSPNVDEIISQGNSMRIKFISSARAVGAKGFKLWWTEIQVPHTAAAAVMSDNWCNGFRCRLNDYCIADELRCNKVQNCGKGDTSDETIDCGVSYHDHGVFNIVLAVVAALATIVLVVVCIVHRRRKRNKRKQKAAANAHHQQQQQQQEALRTGGNRNHGNNDLSASSLSNTLPRAAVAASSDGILSCNDRDGNVEVRYVSRSSTLAANSGSGRGVAMTTAALMTSTSPATGRRVGTGGTGTLGTANRRPIKEKTEKVSIV